MNPTQKQFSLNRVAFKKQFPISILLSFLLVQISFVVSRVSALQVFDDFSNGSQAWIPDDASWNVTNVSPGVVFYRCVPAQNTQTWRRYAPLGPAWAFQSELKFRTLLGNSGTRGVASLGISRDSTLPTSKILVDLIRRSNGTIRIMAAYFDLDNNWYTILDSGTLSGSTADYLVKVERGTGSNTLQVVVQASNGFSYTGRTTPLPTQLLSGILVPGFRVDSATVDFANVMVSSPSVPSPQYRNFEALATNVVNDLVSHFWIGSPVSGQIVNTWNGYTNGPLPDARGGLWERGMLYLTLENFTRFQTNTTINQMLLADWIRTTSVYSSSELEACGQSSGINWAVDDAGWSALMYLAAHRATGDATALAHAKGLVNCSFNRWLDGQLGGGMWYRDLKDIKSLYQVAIVMASFRIYELTGEQSYYDRAMLCYSWMETYLLRNDGLYWVDYNSAGPVGQERPYDIHEAGSVVSLGGTMAMGVLHARLYRMTTNDLYRVRAIRTADALANHLVTAGGWYVNDRDAWTQGTFAGDWAREVLSLPGITARHLTLLRTTADSIYTNARTNGFYGGSWSGPATGGGSLWWAIGSTPEQITTSSSSGNMIIAAAVSDARFRELLRPTLQVIDQPGGNLQLIVTGEPGWEHQLEMTTNLTTWMSLTNFSTDAISRVFKWNGTKPGGQSFYQAFIPIQP